MYSIYGINLGVQYMEIWKLINIFNERREFLTLNEIYDEYANRFDVDNFVDYKAAIRTELYRNCIDRTLNTKYNNIFISIFQKNTRGQKYGLSEWVLNIYNKNAKIVERDVPRYIVNMKFSIVRDTKIKEFVLKHANYSCEYDKKHVSFVKKSDDKNYTEIHHLIPLELQFTEKFKFINLDCPANMVSLCSNCHNCLHYDKDFKLILTKLYNMKKGELERSGIKITLEELISYYM
jgi:hypothetical protein